MKFTPTLLDEIRSRVSITSVVGRKVQWDRRKSNPGRGDMWACCPFHNEKTPSFHVEESKGRYHCFGCKASGDAFTFLVEKDGLSFPEAVERLAEEAGVKLPKASPEELRTFERNKTLYDVLEEAKKFFTDALWKPVGSKALEYIRHRGVTDETIRQFEIGFAPASKSALKDHLLKSGFSEQLIDEAGLLVKAEGMSVSIDRFRDRVIFPIADARGKTIAFGGRAMSSDALAKYLNSPETPIFSKSNTLYNFHRARPKAFEVGQFVVVEGYLDVVLMAQAGMANVAAPLGTALTEQQLALLWKVVPEPTICFDGDKAGAAATARATERAMPFITGSKSLKIAFLQGDEDPADMVASEQVGKLKEVIASAISLYGYFFRRFTEGARINTPEEKSRLEKEMQDQISLIQDDATKKHYRYQTRIWLGDLFFRFDRSFIRKRAGGSTLGVVEDLGEPNTGKFNEEVILGLAVHFPRVFAENDEFFDFAFDSPEYGKFQMELYRLLVKDQVRDVASLYKQIDERFFFVLESVHGREKADKNRPNVIVAERGHRLFARCPVAKYPLDDELILQLFRYYGLLIIVGRVEKDRKRAQDAFAANITVECEAKLDAAIKEVEVQRGHLIELEKYLLEALSEVSLGMYSQSKKISPVLRVSLPRADARA